MYHATATTDGRTSAAAQAQGLARARALGCFRISFFLWWDRSNGVQEAEADTLKIAINELKSQRKK
jgi:hypothetical protein